MDRKTFFITTAIDYPSGKPHIGHAYEKICADVIARFKRLQGFDVHFSTGLDEHGSKIEKAAAKAGMEPQAYVDHMAKFFLELCKVYGISYDDFIRTTEPRHIKVVNEIFNRVFRSGDIYKGFYEGLYCTDCETFYMEKDLAGGKCPVHGKPVEDVKEESYFFSMARYQKALEEHIRKNRDYIMPAGKPEEILNRMKPGLKDLSISRTKIKWGIPLPIDPKHTQYVWMDALINYLSTVGGPGSAKFKEFWPALHIIGTDIVWHHTVIWGSILMSAGIELPRVFVHGFINLGGQKMSKSKGAVVDPIELARKYPADAIRYFLVREIKFGEDGDFSEEALVARINGELLSDLGNLVSRILTLAERAEKEGARPEGRPELDKRLNINEIERHMDRLELHLALDKVMGFVRAVNKYINEKEPWKLLKEMDGLKQSKQAVKPSEELSSVIYNLLESLRIISILISPFMPRIADEISSQLGVEQGLLKDCAFRQWKGRIRKGGHLFKKAEYKPGEGLDNPAESQARDVAISVDDGCKRLGIKICGAVVSGVKVGKKSSRLEKLKKEAVDGYVFRQQEILDGYKNIYEKIGAKGMMHPIENMREIAGRSGKLPTINTVVDSYNVVALQKCLSIGAHDLDKIKGDVSMKMANGSEKYTPLGAGSHAKVNAGEFACMDGEKVICRMDIRQCEETKITEATKNVFIYVQGNSATSEGYLLNALKQACENIVRFCGGSCRIAGCK